MIIQSICVFCSSSNAISSEYHQIAKDLGSELAKRGYTMVFGGANVGLMKSVTEAALANRGKVIGVLPTFIKNKKGVVEGMSELIETADMFERKKKMMELSDAFIILPGGIGTLDEALDMIVQKQLGHIKSPIIFINFKGYYDLFNQLLTQMVNDNFLKPFDDSYIYFSKDISSIWSYLATYGYDPKGEKWF